MKIIRNEKTIKRNSRIGQIASLSSLLVLGGGFYLSLTTRDPNMLTYTWVALILGFLLSQVGIAYANRWSRRPDLALDQALKGMDDRYALYHFVTPVAHLLVGPAGVWVLAAYHQVGKIVYEKKRWKQKGGSLAQRYLRLFGQDSLGRPDLDVEHDVEVLQNFLKKKMPDTELPSIQMALVFLNEKAVLADEETPIPALLVKDLKEYLRKTTKGKALTPEKAKALQDALGVS